MQQINESYEDGRMIQFLEEDEHRPFLNAVRAYECEYSNDRRVRLLESVIRTSRSGRADDRPLPEDAHDTICTIRDRYRMFGPLDELVDPRSYRTAHQMISQLFY